MMKRHERNRRILLVEDRPTDVRLTLRALRKAGYDSLDVNTVSNGREAIDFLEDDEKPLPDLVLLDWMMPLVNGQQVLEYMRKDAGLRKVPVLVLTTSSSEGDVIAAYETGCNAYLTKPVDPIEFQETIEALGLFWLRKALLPA